MVLTVINVYTDSMPVEISKHIRVYELFCKYDRFMIFRVIYLIVVYIISINTIKKFDVFI